MCNVLLGMGELLRQLTERLTQWLAASGMNDANAQWMGEVMMFVVLLLMALVAFLLTRTLMRSIFIPLVTRSENKFDDLLIKHGFFNKLAYLIPAILLYYFNDDTITFPLFNDVIHTVLEIFFVVNVVIILNSILSTINDLYHRFDYSRDHPMKAVFQVLKMITWSIGGLAIAGVLLNRDIGTLVISLGAVSAVLLLIFKDPILGLVGGFQLIFNKMLSIGDWIEMPKFGADGTVMEINLTTVKVQNWDKTIVTIPTYNLITDSFKNWRGMEESGGRRIMRSIFIDIDSVRFADENMLKKFRKIHVLNTYLESKAAELRAYNEKFQVDPSSIVNGRRQTNIGVFRAYIEQYLHNRDDIHDDMTFIVRQLQPTDRGLPIQIYVFTKTVAWVEYEAIQADIFDHIMAVLPEFGLRVFQLPSNAGLARVIA